MVYTGARYDRGRSEIRKPRAKPVRRSVTLPPKIARQVETLGQGSATSATTAFLVRTHRAGNRSPPTKGESVLRAGRTLPRAPVIPNQVKQLGDQFGTLCLWRVMQGNRCRRSKDGPRLPSAVREHLVERMHNRNIGLRGPEPACVLWMESKPRRARRGLWYKDFGSFKLCGEGRAIQKPFFCPVNLRKGKSVRPTRAPFPRGLY